MSDRFDTASFRNPPSVAPTESSPPAPSRVVGDTPATTSTPVLSFSAPQRVHPPKPPLVLNVGVIGHRPDPRKRPNPDLPTLQGTIGDVLRVIADGFRGVATTQGEWFDLAPVDRRKSGLRILSSLAEGADQWVVDEALRLDYSLHVVLPFARAEYTRDFVDPDALTSLRRLLDRADAVLELDGTRAPRRVSESYGAASRTLIQQCDLLIALWDGDEQAGLGGTGQTVREALLHGVPVIWIPWSSPAGEWHFVNERVWRLIERPADLKGDAARLTQILKEILLPPDLASRASSVAPHSLRATYYREVQAGSSPLGGLWRFFSNLMLLGVRADGKLLRAPLAWQVRLKPFDQATWETWEHERSRCPEIEPLMGNVDAHYFAHFAWANQLSIHYGNLYRSGFVLNFALGAIAVFFAVLGIPLLLASRPEWPAVVMELLVIALVVLITYIGSRRGWHERWIEYRTLAERLRLSRFMTLIGGWRQDAALPGHLTSYGDPTNTWVYWHYRAVERAYGFCPGTLDAYRLQVIRCAMQDALTHGQAKYHEENDRLEFIDRRLHRLGTAFFVATLVACVIHLVLERTVHVSTHVSAMILGLNALLPACGAALAAIRSQGEFHRVARRSRSMVQELEELRFRLSVIPARADDLQSQEIRRLSERVAGLMLNETLDWRVVFQDRPLVLPT